MANEIELKERILNQAKDLFYEFGFKKVSVDEIVEKLGISKKTLYKFFETKEKIIHEIVDKMISEVVSNIEIIVQDKEKNFFEKTKDVMIFFRKFHAHTRPQFMQDLLKYMPQLHQHCHNYLFPEIKKNFKKLFQEGVDQKMIRSDVDVDLLITMFITLKQNMMQPEIVSNMPYTIQELHNLINRVMFEGMLSENGRLLMKNSAASNGV